MCVLRGRVKSGICCFYQIRAPNDVGESDDVEVLLQPLAIVVDTANAPRAVLLLTLTSLW